MTTINIRTDQFEMTINLAPAQSIQTSIIPQATDIVTAVTTEQPLIIPSFDEVPTAAEYVAAWEHVIEAATAEQRSDIASAWNDQAALRKQIEWPPGAYEGLRDAVTKAIKNLKTTGNKSDARV